MSPVVYGETKCQQPPGKTNTPMQIDMRPTEATRMFAILQRFTAPSWGAEQIQHAQLTVTGTQVRGAATDSHTAAIQRETLPTAPAEEGQFLVAPKQIKAFITQARSATARAIHRRSESQPRDTTVVLAGGPVRAAHHADG